MLCMCEIRRFEQGLSTYLDGILRIRDRRLHTIFVIFTFSPPFRTRTILSIHISL